VSGPDVAADRFELERLLAMATVAPRDLVKTLMEIDWAADTEGKLAQIDARLLAVREVEDAARRRIVENPVLAGKPLPPVPPPAVMREFTIVMAARSALDKLQATRAALARKR
jgi:hypothetical protein